MRISNISSGDWCEVLYDCKILYDYVYRFWYFLVYWLKKKLAESPQLEKP